VGFSKVKYLQKGGHFTFGKSHEFFLKKSSDTQWVSWGKKVLEKTDGGFYAA
jgi:hypothetical protein